MAVMSCILEKRGTGDSLTQSEVGPRRRRKWLNDAGADGQRVSPVASPLVSGRLEGLWLPALQGTNCVVEASAVSTCESPMEAPPALCICHFLQSKHTQGQTLKEVHGPSLVLVLMSLTAQLYVTIEV